MEREVVGFRFVLRTAHGDRYYVDDDDRGCGTSLHKRDAHLFRSAEQARGARSVCNDTWRNARIVKVTRRKVSP